MENPLLVMQGEVDPETCGQLLKYRDYICAAQNYVHVLH